MSDPQIPTTPTSKARGSLNDYPIRTGELRQRIVGGSPFSRHADTTQAAASELAQERYPKVSASDGPEPMPRTSRLPPLSMPTATFSDRDAAASFVHLDVDLGARRLTWRLENTLASPSP